MVFAKIKKNLRTMVRMNGNLVVLTLTFTGTVFLVSLFVVMNISVNNHHVKGERQNAKMESVLETFHERREVSKENSCYEPKLFTPMRIHQNRTSGYDFSKATMRLNDEKVAMDDGRLLSLIRNYWIQNPSLEPYRFYSNRVDYSSGQSSLVDTLLDNKERGFYVECGAYDGETQSTTLLFERYRKWQGLLIEPDPQNYQKLLHKRRMAFTINACISPFPYPVMMRLERKGLHSKVALNTSTPKRADETDVQCFPLHSILLALNLQAVDFLSLDVSGLELEVLQTMPFSSTNIDAISISCDNCSEKNETGIKNFLQNHGFGVVSKLENYDLSTKDFIFQRRSVVRFHPH